jgi:DNA-binding NarL/FixJ family response regulator
MIVDDHALAREGLRAMLAHQQDLVRGEFPLRPGVAARLLQRLTRESERLATLPEGQLTLREQAVLGPADAA